MIEKLTQDEYGALSWYGRQSNQVGLKALRIIDALTARVKELEAKLAEPFDQFAVDGAEAWYASEAERMKGKNGP